MRRKFAYLCKILDDMKMQFETHQQHAGRPLLTYDTHIEFLYKNNKNKKNQAKRNLMSTLDI